MSKRLAGKDIAQVYFDERQRNRQQGIAQRDTGVRQSPRIQNQELHLFGLGGVHSGNQFVFGIALEGVQFMGLMA